MMPFYWILSPLLKILKFAKNNPVVTVLIAAIAFGTFQTWRLGTAREKIDQAELNLAVSESNFDLCSAANKTHVDAIKEIQARVDAQIEQSNNLADLNDRLIVERDRFELELAAAVEEVTRDVEVIFDEHPDCAEWGATHMCPELIDRLWISPRETGDCSN